MIQEPPVIAAYPGPKSAAMLEELGRYVIAEPQPFCVDLAASEGMTLATVDGQRLFDWAGYYGSKLIGHNHPGLYEPGYVRRLVAAANNKVANPDFLTQECLDYYRLLHGLAPECMREGPHEVYVVNSGAEAVENMLKYLVARHNARQMAAGRMSGNRRFVYFDKAFHGRTVFALSVTQTIDPVATKDFVGLTTGGNIKLPFPAYCAEDGDAANEARAQAVLSQLASLLEHMADEIVGTSSSRSKARAANASPPRASSAAFPNSRTGTGSGSASTRSRPAAARRGRCGRLTTSTSPILRRPSPPARSSATASSSWRSR